jgi:hypothetical protein
MNPLTIFAQKLSKNCIFSPQKHREFYTKKVGVQKKSQNQLTHEEKTFFTRIADLCIKPERRFASADR